MAAQTMTPNPQLGGLQSPSKPTSIQLPTVEATSRDQERVTLLLEINQLLLQEIVTLQEAGKGGDVQSPAKTGEGGKPEEGKSVASQEYVEYVLPPRFRLWNSYRISHPHLPSINQTSTYTNMYLTAVCAVCNQI